MNKYINIEKIKTILQEVEAPDCSLIELLGALKEIATILEQPSADIVEVVRCKDCKYLVEIDDTSNLYVCDRIDIGMDGEPCFLSPENDFCSRGERRDEK